MLNALYKAGNVLMGLLVVAALVCAVGQKVHEVNTEWNPILVSLLSIVVWVGAGVVGFFALGVHRR